jgi:hypothetical protein
MKGKATLPPQGRAPVKGHPPSTALEKGMVALMKKQDLKSITAQSRKGK